ncbi:MAG: dTDP-4-amino-4,6-dideoxygalactose transaminase [Candidatus Auribacterota bacterium]|nr:dTDP-4-amino-4,6-dideoxygalactose transaminase [Candidatus Auribacterota bacterium]
MKYPFNKPALVGRELEYIKDAVKSGKISGDGKYSKKCHQLIERITGSSRVLLTTSGTSALEMAALLIDAGPGDEVIMPSFTFVSTANAFAGRGAKPVFVDIRPDTLNLDESLIEEKITANTKAIVPVHYAGISCEMNVIMDIARRRNLRVIEDAAQGIDSRYEGAPLGSIGDLGAFSFHETKNVICGEGGALLINRDEFIERAEVIWEKGTNRKKFFRGEVDKYTWVDTGSSFLMSDILAAYLYAQLEKLEQIRLRRQAVFETYYQGLRKYQDSGQLRLPVIPDNRDINYHIFYLLLPSPSKRDAVIKNLKESGIHTVFHYVPLHTSPMGKLFGYQRGDLPVSEDISSRLVRLPIYYGLSSDDAQFIVSRLISCL